MAKVTKVSIQAVVSTSGGFTYTANDATAPGAGAGVLGAVLAHRDVDSVISGTRTIIPFESIDHVVVTKTISQVDAPEDETCVIETESADSGSDDSGSDDSGSDSGDGP